MDKYNKLMGRNIKFVRQESLMSLQDLANLLDVSKQCVKKIEDGNGTTTKTFFKIASILGLNPQAFLSESMQINKEFIFKIKTVRSSNNDTE